MRPRIQVALDLIRIEDAVRIASQVFEYIDYLEAGTPLIKAEGLRAVSVLKREFGDKVVVADMKTMDTGYLEASLAFKFGADYSTVMALADIDTVRASIKAGGDYGKGIMVDLMGVDDPVLVKNIDALGPDYLIIHSGIDMQHRGLTPFEPVNWLVNMGLSSRIGVAGGLNIDNIVNLKGLKIDLVIVGGFLTRSDDPRRAARDLLEVIESIF